MAKRTKCRAMRSHKRSKPKPIKLYGARRISQAARRCKPVRPF